MIEQLKTNDLKSLQNKMIQKFGQAQEERIRTGLRQVQHYWQERDGSESEMAAFCLEYFQTDKATIDKSLKRMEKNFEHMYGNLHRIRMQLNMAMEVDCGEILAIDHLFGRFDVYSHVSEDLFASKIAFFIVLNFPLLELSHKLSEGKKWSHQKWNEVRLVDKIAKRIPASILQKSNDAINDANFFISEYNFFMHGVVDEQQKTIFPDGLRLISHWGLRDELKAQYKEKNGFPKQKTIAKLMERIVAEDIPSELVGNDRCGYDPYSNTFFKREGDQLQAIAHESSFKRSEHFLSVFRAKKLQDPYHFHGGNYLTHVFDTLYEVSVESMETMLDSILSAPVIGEIATWLTAHLERPLEPFDIWYNQFALDHGKSDEELSTLTQKRYPTAEAFANDIESLLDRLGFSKQDCSLISRLVQVDPSRGSGHAWGASMRDDKVYMRTRFNEGRSAEGMSYKGFNVAAHELGHNVEEIFTMNCADHYFLADIPNNAFTEAFAFIFQGLDLYLLGLQDKPLQPKSKLNTYQEIWSAFEIAGVAKVEISIWKWLYDHPKASALELSQQVVKIAQEVWNTYYAPVFGKRDQTLLAIYSHMVNHPLYLSYYALGMIIAAQIREYMCDKPLASEMKRMCSIGHLTPDLWMEKAVGCPVSVERLLQV